MNALTQSTKLPSLSISEIKKLLQRREIDANELLDAYIARIEEFDTLNAIVCKNYDAARKSAQQSSKRYKNKSDRLIEGIPIVVKDNFCTNGIRTTACSKILSDFVPKYESTVTTKLLDSGGIILAKSNMDEFAMGSGNLNSYFGPAINPWTNDQKDQFTPGGSSGGSAAAVASSMCAAAIGSDTGGSVRQPASFCGIVGIKPTYGRVSRFGMIAFANSLDQAGILGRSVEDVSLILEVISGYDSLDSTSSQLEVPNWSQMINTPIKGMKIGIPKEYQIDALSEETSALWQDGIRYLKDAGAKIIDISLPHTHYALPIYYIIAPCEASSNLARFDGIRYGHRAQCNAYDSLEEIIMKSRDEGFGREVKKRIMIGNYLLSSEKYSDYYIKAQKIRRLVKEDFDNAFKEVDALLTPTCTSSAFTIKSKGMDPLKMYANDIFTVTANLAGLPAISIPAALDNNNMPLGLQIISRHFDEASLLRVAYQIEIRANFPYLR